MMTGRIPNTFLSSQGYSVRKEAITSDVLESVKRDLTVSPYMPPGYGAAKPEPYKLYKESTSKLYVPKYYGFQKFGAPDIDKIYKGDPISIKFAGKLRPEQEAPVQAFIEASGDPVKRGGILNLPCAFGKTSLSIYIICKLAKKTLVIVHKDFLLQQWKERIEQFAPTARIGLIKAKTIDVEDKDIVLASLQSLSMKTYDPQVLAGFGGVIVDECHHIAAEVFCKALNKVNFSYALGLSATIKRKDGLSKVFHWYLGNVVYSVKSRSDEVDVMMYDYECEDPLYCDEATLYTGKPNISRMINNICEYKPRVVFITDIIADVIKNETERKILVLSDRRGHLHLFKEELDKIGITSGFYYGGLKPEVLKESETRQVILATYQMVSEAFDCPALNCLVIASPKSDVIQVTGRILRTKPEDRKFPPLIIDIIDGFSIFPAQAAKRRAYYKKCKYTFLDGDGSGEDSEEKETTSITKGVCAIRDFDD